MRKLNMQIASMCVTSTCILILGVMLILLDQVMESAIFITVAVTELCRAMISPVFIGKRKLEHYAKTTLISMAILFPVGVACKAIYNNSKLELLVNAPDVLDFFLYISIILSVSIISIIRMCKEFGDLKYRYIMGKKYKVTKKMTDMEEDTTVEEVIHHLTTENAKYFLTLLATFVVGIMLLEMNINLVGDMILIVGLIAIVYSNIYINPKLVEKEEGKKKKLEQKLQELRQYE